MEIQKYGCGSSFRGQPVFLTEMRVATLATVEVRERIICIMEIIDTGSRVLKSVIAGSRKEKCIEEVVFLSRAGHEMLKTL